MMGWILALPLLMPAQQNRRIAPPPAPPALATFPLESLRVDGNKSIAADKIIAASGLRIGRTVEKPDFDSARDRLIATGAFVSVGYEFKPSPTGTGYDGVLTVVEVDQIYPYRFEDLPGSDDFMRAALRKQEPLLGDRIPATAELVNRYVKALEQALGGTASVTGKLIEDVPGNVAIVFRPSVSRPNIAEVRFAGNDALPSTLLTRTLSDVAVGVPYSEPGLRQLLDTSLRPLYDARGRIRVTFPSVAVEKAKNVDGVTVTVAVNEGPVYNLGTVSYRGIPTSEIAQLEKTAAFKKGDIANFDDIAAGMDKAFRRFRNNGYLRISGKAERQIHDAEHTVDVSINFSLGSQFQFGKLQIVGLDIISEPAIRKMWGDLTGKPFPAEFPESFLNRVRGEDLFDNLGQTRAETHIDEASKTVDVTLYFSGARTPARPPN